MCGIAGVLLRPGRRADEAVLRAMADALTHRGPDRQAVLVDGPVGLAATRLAVLDPGPAAAQPMADDRWGLTFNGEIYNHRALGRQLEGEGVRFRGRGDTEVLFQALAQWGVPETLGRLEGMFAFAFVDRAKHEVWLARDRLGIKPLVWRRVAGLVCWASEAKALRPAGRLEVDPVQAAFAVTGAIDRSATATAFRSVDQVPPGHLLQVGTEGTVRSHRWWALEDAVDEALYHELDAAPGADWVRMLGAALDHSVGSMSQADGPVGLFLSGGVDSSVLASYTGDHRPAVLLTADVGGDRSEHAAAQEAASHLGRPLVVERVPTDAVLSDWARATWHLEAPLVTHLNGVAFGRLAQTARREGMRAVLSGEGADELFFGYPEIAARPYLRVAAAPSAVRRWLGGRLHGPWRRLIGDLRHGVDEALASVAGHEVDGHLRRRGAAAFSFLGHDAAERQAEVFPWLGAHLLTLLHRNDAFGMAAGVEARFPFLDEAVVRLGVNLPTKAKVATGLRPGDPKHPFRRDKAVVRDLAARRLPGSVASRPKLGFPVYGHDHVRIAPAFWRDGYVTELFRLPQDTEDLLDPATGPLSDYHLAKLASVEVFGRLYDRDDSIDEVAHHVRAHVAVTP